MISAANNGPIDPPKLPPTWKQKIALIRVYHPINEVRPWSFWGKIDEPTPTPEIPDKKPVGGKWAKSPNSNPASVEAMPMGKTTVLVLSR